MPPRIGRAAQAAAGEPESDRLLGRDMDALHKKKRIGSAVGAALGWFALALFAARPGWSAPLEVYGRLPSLEDVSLSPDGTKLAVIRTTGNARLLAFLSLTDHKL